MTQSEEHKAIDCPKCASLMRLLKAGDVVVDRCEKCYGVFIDKGERVKLMKEKSLVTGLDIGSEETGRKTDVITEINCPRCGDEMSHITDRAQKHIGFEYCRKCEGSFFDAGELTDLSEFTLSERIKSLLGKS